MSRTSLDYANSVWNPYQIAYTVYQGFGKVQMRATKLISKE